MRVIIAGSRHLGFVYHPLLKRTIEGAIFRGWDVKEIVSGCCPTGIDKLGEMWAKEHNIPVKPFPADWKKYGHKAGPLRNSAMAEYSDGLILIWDGKSRGSADMLKKAKAWGLKIIEERI
jgi:hypothetical protein